jgi:hypothetical protein
MGQVESILKKLPKPFERRSFMKNDLILLTDIPSEVYKESVKHDLNKAQIKALVKLEQVSEKVFKDQNNPRYYQKNVDSMKISFKNGYYKQ